MRWHTRKKPLFSLTFLTVFFCFVSIVEASPYYITHPTYFPSKSGSYITFDTSLLPLSFNTLYRDTQTRWHFNSSWLTTTVDNTITVWLTDNWLNYTVSGSGTQEVYRGMKPTIVYIDDVEKSEGDGWTYSSGTTTVTVATSNASLSWAGTIVDLYGLLSGLFTKVSKTLFSFSSGGIVSEILDLLGWTSLPIPVIPPWTTPVLNIYTAVALISVGALTSFVLVALDPRHAIEYVLLGVGFVTIAFIALYFVSFVGNL